MERKEKKKYELISKLDSSKLIIGIFAGTATTKHTNSLKLGRSTWRFLRHFQSLLVLFFHIWNCIKLFLFVWRLMRVRLMLRRGSISIYLYIAMCKHTFILLYTSLIITTIIISRRLLLFVLIIYLFIYLFIIIIIIIIIIIFVGYFIFIIWTWYN